VIQCPPLSVRLDIIRAIDGELNYQNNMSPLRATPGQDNGVAGQLVTLQDYTSRAMAAWTQNPSDDPALDVLRKCAAIAIRALILYGCPERTSVPQS
jgi:hypothetical protein